MMELKRVTVSVPEGVLAEIDTFAAKQHWSRDEFFCEAAGAYLESCRHRERVEYMKRGYEEMAAINLSLAEDVPWAGFSIPEQ